MNVEKNCFRNNDKFQFLRCESNASKFSQKILLAMLQLPLENSPSGNIFLHLLRKPMLYMNAYNILQKM